MFKTFRQFIKEQSIQAGPAKRNPGNSSASSRLGNAVRGKLSTAVFGKYLGGIVNRKPPPNRAATRHVPYVPKSITTGPTMEEDWSAIKDAAKRGLRRAVFGKYLGNLIGAKNKKKKKKRTIPESTKPSTAERFAKNLKKGGFDLSAHEKRSKELADRNAELRAKYADLLKKEEAGPVSVYGGAVPSITDPTTNYAAQQKKKSNMLRRKKPQ